MEEFDPSTLVVRPTRSKRERDNNKPPKIRYTSGGTLISTKWDSEHIAAIEEIEAEVGHAICGGKKRAVGDEQGLPCKNWPGLKTEHVGVGRCSKHGGTNTVKHGKFSLLRKHQGMGDKVSDFLESAELLDIRAAVATAWAAVDELMPGDEAEVSPERAKDIVNSMKAVGTLIKQHHDITAQQKITIEIPQFMQWAEALYELAVKYIQQSGGDVRGFLTEAQRYYTSTISIVTGERSRAIGDGGVVEAEIVLRPGEQEPGGPGGAP